LQFRIAVAGAGQERSAVGGSVFECGVE